MSLSTLIIYLAMYAYGFPLMVWAIFFDKKPTRLSVKAAILGLIGLSATVFYTAYVLWRFGITS